jgi:hypothetical protein
MQGDTSKAKAAYHDFLTLWKDADRDIPILKPATTEYANYISRLRKMCARLRIGILDALAVRA